MVSSPWWSVACSSTERNGTDPPARGGSAGLGGASGDAGTSGGGAGTGAGGAGATSGAGRGGGAGATGGGGEGGETGEGGAGADSGAGDGGGAGTGGVSGVGGSGGLGGADTGGAGDGGADTGGAGTGDAGIGGTSGNAGAAGSAGDDSCPEGSTGANCDGCVVYVNQSGGANTNDGRTWASAKADPQAGIDAAYASSPACEVWVAQGTYVPTYKADPFAAANTATLLLRPGIALFGGFAAGELSKNGRDVAAHVTILTGEIGAATNTDNLANVITTSAEGASLDGFGITRGYGGAIDCTGGALTLRSCTLYENTGYYGGALASSGGCSLLAADSVFRDNLATTSQLSGPRGAAIYATGPLTIERSRFSDNRGTGGAPSGGAVFAADGVTVRDSLFENNSVTAGSAGGLYVAGAATVESSTFRDNRALSGAAIYSTSSLVVRGSLFDNNLSSGDPALGAVRGWDIDVSDSTFTGNRADAGLGATQAYGGALAASGVVRIRRTTFDNNSVSAANGTGGGAFYCSATCSATLVAVRFRNGSVTGGLSSYGGGGAIYFAGTAFSADQCEFANNTALDTGGAIANRASPSSQANLTLTNSTFFGNGSESGGAVYNEYRPSTFLNSIFWDNTATVEGPQIFNASDLATSTVRACNVQGSGFDGTNGNIDEPPLFMNTVSTPPDLRLQAGSPGVNGGNNADLAADALDLDGDGDETETVPLDVHSVSRVQGGTVDMGAHERGP